MPRDYSRTRRGFRSLRLINTPLIGVDGEIEPHPDPQVLVPRGLPRRKGGKRLNQIFSAHSRRSQRISTRFECLASKHWHRLPNSRAWLAPFPTASPTA
jgi:hypothetical protein